MKRSIITLAIALLAITIAGLGCARTPEERAQFYRDYMMGRAMTAPLPRVEPVGTKDDPACYTMREDNVYYRLYCR